jgi:hypothetical protein
VFINSAEVSTFSKDTNREAYLRCILREQPSWRADWLWDGMHEMRERSWRCWFLHQRTNEHEHCQSFLVRTPLNSMAVHLKVSSFKRRLGAFQHLKREECCRKAPPQSPHNDDDRVRRCALPCANDPATPNAGTANESIPAGHTRWQFQAASAIACSLDHVCVVG